jgi:hypothetical protein
MKRGKEEDVLARSGILEKRFHLLHSIGQRLLQPRKIVVIFASAVLLPKRIIELGGERQFANEVAERCFVEHNV